MDAERERELLDLIRAYWKIRRATTCYVSEVSYPAPAVHVDFGGDCREYAASWAESRGCNRELERALSSRRRRWSVGPIPNGTHEAQVINFRRYYGLDPSPSVALLRAYVSAFGEKEPARP